MENMIMNIMTNRCIIRAFKEKDLDTFVSYRNNEKWMVYQDFKGYTKEQYRKMIIGESHNILNGIQLAIANKVTDELLGDLYLEASENTCHLGYTIHPSHARKGYVYEAVISLIPYLKKNGITSIIASAHHQNIASLNLLEKLRFEYVGIASNGDRKYQLKLDRY